MIQLIRGFKDILPGEIEIWQQIESTACALFEDFGFKEIRIPVMERTELFARSIGEDTDIVEKEMYTFPDRKGDLITLREGEFITGVLRFVIPAGTDGRAAAARGRRAPPTTRSPPSPAATPAATPTAVKVPLPRFRKSSLAARGASWSVVCCPLTK